MPAILANFPRIGSDLSSAMVSVFGTATATGSSTSIPIARNIRFVFVSSILSSFIFCCTLPLGTPMPAILANFPRIGSAFSSASDSAGTDSAWVAGALPALVSAALPALSVALGLATSTSIVSAILSRARILSRLSSFSSICLRTALSDSPCFSMAM